MLNLKELAESIHQNNIAKGFFEKEKNIGEMLCLIHSEVSEALEADRKDMYFNKRMEVIGITDVNGNVDENKFQWDFQKHCKGTFEEEMADIIIRVLDLCAFLKIDIDAHIIAKVRFNSLREKYHGKKY